MYLLFAICACNGVSDDGLRDVDSRDVYLLPDLRAEAEYALNNSSDVYSFEDLDSAYFFLFVYVESTVVFMSLMVFIIHKCFDIYLWIISTFLYYATL